MGRRKHVGGVFRAKSDRSSSSSDSSSSSSTNSTASAKPTLWIEQNIVCLECAKFVPARGSSNNPRCCCGLTLSQHSSAVQSAAIKSVSSNSELYLEKWHVKTHTQELPTNAYGTVEFQGGAHPTKARYVRIHHETCPEKILHLLLDVWSIRVPNLVISIIGGLANAPLQTKVQQVVQKGLPRAAKTTGAWIITNGLDIGVTRHIGEALRDEVHVRGSNIVALGIAPWSYVQHRDSLVGNDKVCSYYSQGWRPGRQEAPLSSDHNYFLLADNGTVGKFGGELGLRRRLEQYLAQQPIDMRLYGGSKSRVPVVGVLLEGGTQTFRTVFELVTGTNPVPVVVCDGSGRAADLLAFMHRYCNEDGDLSGHLKDQMIANICRTFQLRQFEAEGLYSELKLCMKCRHFISVFRMGEGDSDEIDITILTALLQVSGQNLTPAEQLSLTMAWNRPDIARSKVFAKYSNWSTSTIENAMADALLNDRLEFVQLLLTKGLDIHKFLTKIRLEELYNVAADANNQSFRKLFTKVLGTKQSITLRGVGHLIESLMSGGYQHTYCDKPVIAELNSNSRNNNQANAKLESQLWANKMITNSTAISSNITPGKLKQSLFTNSHVKTNNVTIDDNNNNNNNNNNTDSNNKALKPNRPLDQTAMQQFWSTNSFDYNYNDNKLFRYPYTELLQWVLLTGRFNMLQFMVLAGEESIAKALFAVKILRCIRHEILDENTEVELANDYRAQESAMEKLAVDLQGHCYRQDPELAKRLLSYELYSFSKNTCLSLAYMCESKVFISQPCTQSILNDLWYGGLRKGDTVGLKVAVILIGLLIPPIYPLIAFLFTKHSKFLEFKTKEELAKQPQTLQEHLDKLDDSSSQSSSSSSSTSSVTSTPSHSRQSSGCFDHTHHCTNSGPSDIGRADRINDLSVFYLNTDESIDPTSTMMTTKNNNNNNNNNTDDNEDNKHDVKTAGDNKEGKTLTATECNVNSPLEIVCHDTAVDEDHTTEAIIDTAYSTCVHQPQVLVKNLTKCHSITMDKLSICSDSKVNANAGSVVNNYSVKKMTSSSKTDTGIEGAQSVHCNTEQVAQLRRPRFSVHPHATSVGSAHGRRNKNSLALRHNLTSLISTNHYASVALASNRRSRTSVAKSNHQLSQPPPYNSQSPLRYLVHQSIKPKVYQNQTQPPRQQQQLTGNLKTDWTDRDGCANHYKYWRPNNFPLINVELRSANHTGTQLSWRKKVYEFFSAPVTRFYLHVLLYLLFLAMFIGLCIHTIPANSFSYLEFYVYLHILTYLLDKFREVTLNPGSNYFQKLKVHSSAFWNIYDITMCTITIIAIIIRYIGAIYEMYYMWGKNLLIICCALWQMRFAELMQIWRFSGPYIYMLFKMVRLIIPMLTLLFLPLVAFGTIRQGIMYPSHKYVNLESIKGVMLKPYFMLYGEVYAGDIDPVDWPEESRNAPFMEIVPIATVIYLVYSIILFVNVVIAVFNDIFASVRVQSELVYNYLRYAVIIEYESRPLLPPPFIIISWMYMFIRYLYRLRRNRRALQQINASGNGNNPDELIVDKLNTTVGNSDSNNTNCPSKTSRNWCDRDQNKFGPVNHPSAGLKLFLNPEEVEKLHDFEEECVEDYSRELRKSDVNKTASQVGGLNKKIDQLQFCIEEIYVRQRHLRGLVHLVEEHLFNMNDQLHSALQHSQHCHPQQKKQSTFHPSDFSEFGSFSNSQPQQQRELSHDFNQISSLLEREEIDNTRHKLELAKNLVQSQYHTLVSESVRNPRGITHMTEVLTTGTEANKKGHGDGQIDLPESLHHSYSCGNAMLFTERASNYLTKLRTRTERRYSTTGTESQVLFGSNLTSAHNERAFERSRLRGQNARLTQCSYRRPDFTYREYTTICDDIDLSCLSYSNSPLTTPTMSCNDLNQIGQYRSQVVTNPSHQRHHQHHSQQSQQPIECASHKSIRQWNCNHKLVDQQFTNTHTHRKRCFSISENFETNRYGTNLTDDPTLDTKLTKIKSPHSRSDPTEIRSPHPKVGQFSSAQSIPRTDENKVSNDSVNSENQCVNVSMHDLEGLQPTGIQHQQQSTIDMDEFMGVAAQTNEDDHIDYCGEEEEEEEEDAEAMMEGEEEEEVDEGDERGLKLAEHAERIELQGPVLRRLCKLFKSNRIKSGANNSTPNRIVRDENEFTYWRPENLDTYPVVVSDNKLGPNDNQAYFSPTDMGDLLSHMTTEGEAVDPDLDLDLDMDTSLPSHQNDSVAEIHYPSCIQSPLPSSDDQREMEKSILSTSEYTDMHLSREDNTTLTNTTQQTDQFDTETLARGSKL